jgi:hypothetical protein
MAAPTGRALQKKVFTELELVIPTSESDERHVPVKPVLQWACKFGYCHIVRGVVIAARAQIDPDSILCLLNGLDRGAHLAVGTSNGGDDYWSVPPLQYAAHNDHLGLFRLLLNEGCDPNIKWTAVARRSGNFVGGPHEPLDFHSSALVSHCGQCETQMAWVLRNKRKDLWHLLVEYGASIEQSPGVLSAAEDLGNPAILIWLLEYASGDMTACTPSEWADERCPVWWWAVMSISLLTSQIAPNERLDYLNKVMKYVPRYCISKAEAEDRYFYKVWLMDGREYKTQRQLLSSRPLFSRDEAVFLYYAAIIRYGCDLKRISCGKSCYRKSYRKSYRRARKPLPWSNIVSHSYWLHIFNAMIGRHPKLPIHGCCPEFTFESLLYQNMVEAHVRNLDGPNIQRIRQAMPGAWKKS